MDTELVETGKIWIPGREGIGLTTTYGKETEGDFSILSTVSAYDSKISLFPLLVKSNPCNVKQTIRNILSEIGPVLLHAIVC